jgi:hypothetical protein
MKPNSYRLAIAIALCMSILSFTPRTVQHSFLNSADNTYYYWFNADDDSYDDYTNTTTEIVRLQTEYGVPVDGSAFGGTLVSRGYTSRIVPHQVWPSVYLYAHF